MTFVICDSLEAFQFRLFGLNLSKPSTSTTIFSVVFDTLKCNSEMALQPVSVGLLCVCSQSCLALNGFIKLIVILFYICVTFGVGRTRTWVGFTRGFCWVGLGRILLNVRSVGLG